MTEAKVVIEMRKEAHSTIEEKRRALLAALHTFHQRRMDFLYDSQMQILLNRGQVEVRVDLMEPLAKVIKQTLP